MHSYLCEIIKTHCQFHEEKDIENKNFKGRIEELKNLILYSIDLWNFIIYAWTKISDEKDKSLDSRFYFQSIIFNLYMLGAITNRVEDNILDDFKNLKDMRDNIAHMDEKLKHPLKYVPINDVYNDALTFDNGKIHLKVGLNGLNINDKFQIASPLGVLGNIIFSSLEPNKSRTSYSEFVSIKIDEDELLRIQKKYIEFLNKYFKVVKGCNSKIKYSVSEILK